MIRPTFTCRVKELLNHTPLEVHFAGGWKRISYGSEERFRDRNTVVLYKEEGVMVARLYPDTEVRYRWLTKEDWL